MAGLEVFNDRAKGQTPTQGLPPGYLDWALNVTNGYPNLNGAVFPNLGFPHNDYDYYKAYLENVPSSTPGHLNDIGKKPTHPTYSNESAYAWGGDPNAGKWYAPSLAAQMGTDTTSPWLYHNPAKGLIMAPEEQAYQHKDVPKTYQIFKSAPSVLDRFKNK